MSQVGRRLAQKTSALGLAGTLALFVCSVFALSSPAQAAVDKTMDVLYDCTGGVFAGQNKKVTISAPETVAPSQQATIKWTFTAFTASPALTASTPVTVKGNLTIGGGGSPAALEKTQSGSAPVGNTYTPSQMTATVTAPASGGPITVSPGTAGTTKGLTLTATISGQENTTECTYKSATPTTSLSIAVQAGGGGGTDTDVVEYSCDVPSTSTDTSYEAIKPEIKVVLTPPTSATANADASVTWAGTIQTTGDQLKLPTGFPTTGAKMFATIKGSGAGVPATATGEAAITAPTAGSPLTTLPSVTVKIKPTTTGEVTLTAGDLAFGTSATAPALKCTAPTTGLKQFKFTVGNGTTSPSPTTTTPRPTTTHTATVTVTPSTTRSSSTPTKKSQTPKAGADTGAGGMAGPDGRLFILTGTALVAAAAVGGLVMRRRSIRS
ncbi:hypothetical protein AB0K18_23635 [Nonomuraea sp. NPDC049421]|uniref:hypothetical protein n=1 Tax=Nonomuraea sp. NPDC049421 TaxID=3155275 RepID=UPI00343F9572